MMGFFHPWKREIHFPKASPVAFAVLESNLGVWHAGYSRKNPEIRVEMITQISRNLRAPSRPTVWFKRLSGWLRFR
jgi:hypothetical protein